MFIRLHVWIWIIVSETDQFDWFLSWDIWVNQVWRDLFKAWSLCYSITRYIHLTTFHFIFQMDFPSLGFIFCRCCYTQFFILITKQFSFVFTLAGCLPSWLALAAAGGRLISGLTCYTKCVALMANRTEQGPEVVATWNMKKQQHQIDT